MKKSIYIRLRNAFNPGYSECSRCGGNWGWKKDKSHATSEYSSLFLFCEDCDKIVTKEERWVALDGWKKRCVEQISGFRYSMEEMQKHINDIYNTEFIEFPRSE